MSVVFDTFEVIKIDGIPAGNIVDVISNHAPRRAEVLAAFGVYVAKLQTEINAEKVLLEADKAKLTTDLATKTTAYDAEVVKVAALEAERIVLNNKITFLNSIKTYDTNKIKSLAFYDRISKDQINKLGLLAINDPKAAEIHQLLNAYKDNPWPVLLNDPLVTNGIQYLLYIEILTQEEAAQLTRPATRAEAYEEPE